MKVKHLVQNSFLTISPYQGSASVKKELLKRTFLVVMDKKKFIGILTSDDLLKSPRNLVLDCLHEKPLIDCEESIDSVLKIMKKTQNTVLPVFKKEKFEGVIIRADIAEYLAEYQKELETLNNQLVSEIEARKKAEEEKIRLQAQIQQDQKMQALGNLAGGIAHEFNNILTIILGNTELAIDRIPETESVRKNLESVRKAGFRGRDVVRQLLNFCRKADVEKKPIHIATVLRESLELIRSAIPVTIDIQEAIPDMTTCILADQTQIHQIIINLCTNAAHAMRESGGILKVEADQIRLTEDSKILYKNLKPGKYLKITVRDNGHGIPPEIRDRIFEPYFTTKAIGEGTGMGLAVVHGIVRNYGGDISVESELGKGTSFQILIPVIEKIPLVMPENAPVSSSGKESLLFVDDEESITDFSKQMLERFGYQVTALTNPIEALERFRSDPAKFDLVITDMTMPRMTGDALTKEILAIRSDTPIILCTGFNEKISPEKAKAIGIREYIQKPVEKKEFAGIIRKVLNSAGKK